MIYFFQNMFTIISTMNSFFYTNKINYIDYDSEDDELDEVCVCWSCETYRILHKFTYCKLKTYK